MKRMRARSAPTRAYPALALAAGAILTGVAVPAADDPVHLTRFKTIRIPAQPDDGEVQAARALTQDMAEHWGVACETVSADSADVDEVILVGRAAVTAGAISRAELDAVKHDGYVIKARGRRIALSGYDRVGTRYAAAALLRRMGLRVYPWRYGTGTISIPPDDPAAGVPPFTVATRPFWEHRDLLTLVRPDAFGTTFREYRLSNPQQGANPELFGRDRKPGYTKYTFERSDWVDWWHTAPYLVPRDLYYDEHPEYFAMRGGQRAEPARYGRTQPCTSHPDVVRISTERMLEFVRIQNDRRYFPVNPGDTRTCDCAECRRMDPTPHYATDRVLKWVNTLAGAVREKYPDKVILGGAYSDYVKPPLKVKPGPNVIVWYAPWFWNSRTSSWFTFEHPLNLTAMQELMAWVILAPGQVGVFDYPGGYAIGGARRIKMYSRLGIRTGYFNGARGDDLLWLGSRMMWDPFQDIEPLYEEFVRAHYGPAAEPMNEILRTARAALDRHGRFGRSVFTRTRTGEASVGPEYYSELRRLIEQAEQLAVDADDLTRIRVFERLCREMDPLLVATHPRGRTPRLRSPPEVYKRDVDRFMRLSEIVIRESEARKFPLSREARTQFDATMAAIGLAQPVDQAQRGGMSPEESASLFDRTIAGADDMLRQSLSEAPAFDPGQPRFVTVRFDGEDEAGKWRSDGTRAELIAPVRAATLTTAAGDRLRGAQVQAPLSRLPLIPAGNIRVHAGGFRAERTFEPPLDVEGCCFLEIHVHASRDVPVSVFMDTARSDLQLHAGEQIVRIDFQNHLPEVFDVRNWKQIKSIALEMYPQDHEYPHPEARDTALTVMSLTAANRDPEPGRLPHRGKAIWLTQFRPNLPLRLILPEEHRALFNTVNRTGLIGNGGGREAFRTFTEHRAVSPVYAILTGGAESRRKAAEALQHYLDRVFGVRLPIDPAGPAATPDTGNVILLGSELCQAAGRVDADELDYVGVGGFAINAQQGRIALAGADAAGDAAAAKRYLEDHFVRFFAPGQVGMTDLKGEFLHELYTLDRPWFADRRGWEREWLAFGEHGEAVAASPAAGDAAGARASAEEIKDLARAGRTTVPDELLDRAARSPLTRYVAARLLRNPFEEATGMIRGFLE